MRRPGESRAEVALRNLFLAVVLVFMAAPIALVVVNSFNQSPFNAWPPPGWTLDWYRRALTYAPFHKGAANSAMVAAGTTAIVLFAATPAAYALAQARFRGKTLLRGVILGPLVVPRVAIGLALFVLFLVLRLPLYGSLWGVALAHAVICTPIALTILVANFAEIDPAIEEAARDLGAGQVRAFVLTVLPQVRSGMVVTAALVFVLSFDEVEATLFLTTPGTATLPIEMYRYLEFQQEPMIAAVSTILVSLPLVFVLSASLLNSGTTPRRGSPPSGPPPH